MSPITARLDTRPRAAAPTRNRYGYTWGQVGGNMRELSLYFTDAEWLLCRYLQEQVWRAYSTSD